MKTIHLTIDGTPVEVPEGTTVMQAADQVGVRIPRLCYHPRLSIEGACRVCVVEVEGMRNLPASCALPVAEGMKVKTFTPEIRRIRRDIVELILDNHPMDCQTCERDANCELQRLAYQAGVRERLFEGERKHYPLDLSSPSLIRDPNKCILCYRCVRLCSEVQGVGALGYAHRGFKTVVMPAYNAPFEKTVCVACGQCVNVCPTASLVEQDSVEEVWDALNDPNKHVVIQVAPSVRAAIGEGFGYPPGLALTSKMVAAIRHLGFDKVLDTQFSADLTIMEEGAEFVKRLQGKGPIPLITSCSPGWVKFAEHFYPEFLSNMSTAKSPMSMMGAVIKTFYAQKLGIDPKNIYSVAAMCCTAKKFEAKRPEMGNGEYQYVDAVITTRELIKMIKNAGIDFANLKDEDFDHPLGLSTGAAAIFGVTGGLAESVMRSAYFLVSGKHLDNIEAPEVRGLQGVKEMEVDVEGTKLRFAVSHGLGNAHKLLERVKEGKEQYHFIEIMGCPGGCIGGGGQPYAGTNALPLDPKLLAKRIEALYLEDKDKPLRRSYENPEVQQLYKDFLGEPNSPLAHELLHTFYYQRIPPGIGFRLDEETEVEAEVTQ
ncbi:MAG: iron hydrogenase small subunit [Armatimonadetes bacterium]|nr:iron hydrogenase small subunit [Armatimonadota bacterium]